MAITVKEIKEDAIINISVNKTYYQMVKNLAFYVYQQSNITDAKEYTKEIANTPYIEMTELQQSFHTLVLLIKEIENQAVIQKVIEEKQIIEPGEKDYVEPKLD
jgi:aminopeptidase-like protein